MYNYSSFFTWVGSTLLSFLSWSDKYSHLKTRFQSNPGSLTLIMDA